MPVIPINYLAVLAGGIVSMVLGFLWYGPLFGKPWIAAMGWKGETRESVKQKSMTKQYSLMFLGSLIMTYVFAHALIFGNAYLNASGISAGLMAAFWYWIGFIAPVSMGSVLWEGKSWKLWMINNGYYLVLLMINGMILATWK